MPLTSRGSPGNLSLVALSPCGECATWVIFCCSVCSGFRKLGILFRVSFSCLYSATWVCIQIAQLDANCTIWGGKRISFIDGSLEDWTKILYLNARKEEYADCFHALAILTWTCSTIYKHMQIRVKGNREKVSKTDVSFPCYIKLSQDFYI